ncbi:MAG TPA: poly-beta-1,6-N-acetyl-D-glucosamine N-deacetylase PgaB [Pseudomonadales bacterium]
MNLRAALILIALLWSGAARAELLALCYHDVTTTTSEALRDPTTVSVSMLISQFNWLDANGYVPVRLSDVLAARNGGPALPERAVLLTFDDGYASFHRLVLPLLELYGFPALLAPVTSWVDAPAALPIRYGDENAPRERFLNWEKLREIARSGLVEIASHTHDLHRGIPGNPQGNTQPAVTTLAYDAATGTYETPAEQRQRIWADLAASASLIERELGTHPAAIVWPYGEYSQIAQQLADDLGMSVSLTLDDPRNTIADASRIHRLLIGSDMGLPEFVLTVRNAYSPAPLRAAHVDLDYVYDPDPLQQERNLGMLLDRIKALNLGTVILQAFADPDGNGAADALYFPNRHLPMRADLFNRAAWQLKTRAGVRVFAWLPVLAFEPGTQHPGSRVAALLATDEERYPRLSPFDPRNVALIEDIYADLAASSHMAGLLFHDDALLAEDEDTSDAAIAFYREHWSLASNATAQAIASSGDLTRLKTEHLIALTHRLTDAVKRFRPAIRTARNVYAPVLLSPDAERRFAQSYGRFLEAYDYTALMAMPYLEGAADPGRWLKRVVETVARHPNGLDRTLFELQTVDWHTGIRLPDEELARHLDVLLYSGARHIAYYPDDFLNGRPALETLRSRLSNNAYVALPE